MAIYDKEEEVYQAVCEALDVERLGTDTWRTLTEQRYVLDVLNETDPPEVEECFGRLVDRAGIIEEHRRTNRKKPRKLDRSPIQRAAEVDSRGEMIPFILAAEAAHSPPLRQFRQEILGKKVHLSAKAAVAWLQKQRSVQGPPTVHIQQAYGSQRRSLRVGPIARSPHPTFFDGPWNPEVEHFLPRAVLREIDSGHSLDFPGGHADIPKIASLHVRHHDPHHPGLSWSLMTEMIGVQGLPPLPVRLGFPLSGLKSVATYLERALGLASADWAWFALTGEPPQPKSASARVASAPCPALDEIELRVTPCTPRGEVVALLRAAKERLVDFERQTAGPGFSFGKRIEDRPLWLAAFAAQENDGKSWDEARAVWNKQHPEVPYGPDGHFGRDARESYQRVTGKRLRWKRRRGRVPRRA